MILHKKTFNLKNYTIVNFDWSFFPEVLNIFKKFQKIAKISPLLSKKLDLDSPIYEEYLAEELKTLINKHEKTLLTIDLERNRVFAVYIFSTNVLTDNSAELQIGFKDPDYNGWISNEVGLQSHKDIIKRCRKDLGKKDIYSVLMHRDKYDSYIKYMSKCFGVKLIKVDQLGRHIVEYPNYE